MTPPKESGDHASGDLASLTLTQMQPLVDSAFSRANPPEPDIVLQLISAELTQRDPNAEAVASGRPFSLLFRGPTEVLLTQGMHDLAHPARPLSGVFLVPVGKDEEGPLYEAVFG